jgi:hypothetical protein
VLRITDLGANIATAFWTLSLNLAAIPNKLALLERSVILRFQDANSFSMLT